MNILLLSPGKLDFYGVSSAYPFFYPRLGIRILGNISPADYEVKILEHEQVKSINYTEDVDIVGISVITPHADLSYEIADQYRLRGVQVVLGGIHPTIMPEEAKRHADAVVIGEAENIWLSLLEDAKKRQLKPFYKADYPTSPEQIPNPKRLPTDQAYYGPIFHVESGRGCRIGCDFCVVPLLLGRKVRFRSPHVVLQEAVRERDDGKIVSLIFSDNLLSNHEHAIEFCKEIRKQELTFSAEGDLPSLDDEEYLDILAKSGIKTIYIETKAYSKSCNPTMFEKHKMAIEKITNFDIQLSINFTVGYDDHDASIFDTIIELVSKYKLQKCLFQLLVPWPGTPIYNELSRQGRIITRDWSSYNNCEIVFVPKLMTEETILDAFYATCDELFRKQPF